MSQKPDENDPAVRSSASVSPATEMLEVASSCSPVSECPPANLNDRWMGFGVCIFLAAIVWVVFGQTLGQGFVNYDDSLYVYENPMVIHGLNLKSVEWAFTHVVASNWHPLTMMSHMLDCQLYGLHAGGHHMTSVLLHTASVILLFLVLRQMTGKLWRSAFVAAVFAIHPLRVESVAWVAERKDVLSGLFFMLTLWAYTRYAQGRSRVEPSSLRSAAPGGRESSARSGGLALDRGLWTLDYYLVLLFFALGLLSKPMAVTLPFVLLLLDYWPLNRFAPLTPAPAATGNDNPLKKYSIPWRLILEKIPLLAITGAACVATMVVQKDIIMPAPLTLRIGNAAVSYVIYLRQMFYPAGLAVLYPYPESGLPGWEITLAVVLLAAISSVVFLQRQKKTYWLTGWLWYLGMLVPAIGLVQSGSRAHADRYTYLPQIGLYLLLTWTAAELCAGWRHRRVVLGGGSAVILAVLIFCAHEQTAYWRNNESLWTHTLACTSDNAVAHNNLGDALFQKGNVDEAITHCLKALRINPDYAEAHMNLGNALLQKGRVDEAIAHFQKALQITPVNAEAHMNLGNALLQKGRVDEAIAHFQKALEINHDYAKACYNLGNALLQKGRVDEAIVYFQKTLQIEPNHAKAHINLGNILLQKRSMDEAIAHYQQALQITPDSAEAHNNLGSILLQKGRVDEAIIHYQKTVQITPDRAEAHINLGNALLKMGNVAEAIPHFQKALQITPDSAEVQNDLAWVLATCPQASLRNGQKAVELAQRANQLTGDGNPAVLGTLATAYAEAGRFPEAMETAQRALQLAGKQSNPALADAIRSQMKLYQAGTPFHLP